MNINRSRVNKICPHIQVKPFAINTNYDDLINSDKTPLYHVIVSQGLLKMLFLVAHDKTNNREFEVIKCEYIALHGINERDIYDIIDGEDKISSDPTIINKNFKWVLEPYGIKLLKVTNHSFEFIESDKELKGFIFEDQDKYNILKDLINAKCQKVLKNPYIIQY